ncbi:hypothetical protein NBZ79_05015 [Sneathiella marina]|uniref:Uncharacterized protein n=1 Tax=Sneathiella marina TaxID=2950108 RepID=A0ABY4W683_9PROT|nr:hypothetical protein [Sneathiella marina]USG62339.1 hypothetical protein NBZ79_05015 [Sneathiella marina]
MPSASENARDLDALVADSMSGKTGFANTKKLQSMGIEGYKKWKQGKCAEDAIKTNDPRKRKRAARKTQKSES